MSETKYCLYCDQDRTKQQFYRKDWHNTHLRHPKCQRCIRANVRLVSSPDADTLVFEIGR
jgi:transposase-like protein